MLPLLLSAANCDRWAVLIAGSKDWWNYRHQADIATIYSTLLERGFSKDKIITLSYNDIPTSAYNAKYKNQLFHTTAHINMYKGASTIDYSGKQVTKDTFFSVLLGTASGRKLESTKEDDVLVYFNDHGAPGVLGLPTGNEGIPMDELGEVILSMNEKQMYKRLLFVAEACNSGHLPFFIKAPNTVVLTAASQGESSYGANDDEELENFLSNQFTCAVLDNLEVNDQMSLEDFHTAVNYSTLNSTPQIGGGGYQELKGTKVSVFFGTKNANKVLDKARLDIRRPRRFSAKHNQRQISRAILEKMGTLTAKLAIHKKEKQRKLLLERLKQISVLLGYRFDSILHFHETKHGNLKSEEIDWKTYFSALKAFQSRFGAIDEDDMDLNQFFINILPFTTKEKLIDVISIIQ